MDRHRVSAETRAGQGRLHLRTRRRVGVFVPGRAVRKLGDSVRGGAGRAARIIRRAARRPLALLRLRHLHADRNRYADRTRREERDRKSTRLNSSHQIISYAVFCLKKKKKSPSRHGTPTFYVKDTY